MREPHMPDLYRDQFDGAKANAQENLRGRTHFVDDGTLRWHKSRVVYAHSQYGGWLFAVIVTDAMNWENTRRGYRYQVFDVFGTTVARVPIEDAFATRKACETAMLTELKAMNPREITSKGIEHANYWHAREIEKLEEKLNDTGAIYAAQSGAKPA